MHIFILIINILWQLDKLKGSGKISRGGAKALFAKILF